VCVAYVRINLGKYVCVAYEESTCVCCACIHQRVRVCADVCLNFMHHIRKGLRGDKRAHAQVSKAAFVTGLLAAVLQLAAERRMGREGDGEAKVRMRPRAQPALIGNLQGETGKRLRYRGPSRYPKEPCPHTSRPHLFRPARAGAVPSSRLGGNLLACSAACARCPLSACVPCRLRRGLRGPRCTCSVTLFFLITFRSRLFKPSYGPYKRCQSIITRPLRERPGAHSRLRNCCGRVRLASTELCMQARSGY
jgi:hypothetical protein